MWITDDILSRINIVDIISRYVDLKKIWSNYKWLCPFHNEKTPSFIVSEEKQIFKCFWCWKWWNAITFLKEIENIDFFDTLKILAKEAWIELDNKKYNKEENKKELDKKEILIKINKTALNFFHKELFNNEKAYEYINQKRQISKELIIKYKLWYAWNNLIKYLEEKWFKKDDIIESWLARKSSSWSIYPFFKERIIFPIFSWLWDTIAFSWRIFNWETNTWKYINTPETILYHKSNILYNYNNAKKSKKDFIIIVEWYMDVIWLDRLWYDNAIATCGTALTEQHIKALKRLWKKIIFSFDSDNAWLQASLRWIWICLKQGIYPLIFKIENWKDFDEIANNKESVNILEKSQDIIIFFINTYLDNYKNIWPIEKKEKLDKVLDIISEIPDYSIFWNYLEIISKKIWQDVNIVYQQIKSKKQFKKNIKQTDSKYIDYTIESLFFNDFYKKFNLDIKIENALSILKDNLDKNNILNKIYNWNLNTEEKEKILEKQIWWEEKLGTLTKEKIQTNLNNEIKKYISKLIIKTIKQTNLENEKKIELIKALNTIRT